MAIAIAWDYGPLRRAMSNHPPESRDRPLSVLRETLDTLDRDVLQLLAERMRVVAEIAAHKRQNAVRIRDLARERAILTDRKAQAEALGLPPSVIESIWRLLMLASRDHQASLRAEVPLHVEAKTIAILGGQGGMGRVLHRMFADLGHTVLISDLGTPLSAVDAAKRADVVIVSVPIQATEEVIRAVGPHVRKDGLLMDVTSIKQLPLDVMMASTEASVIGTHPMFGPGVHTFQGQRVVVCRGRGDAWWDWLTQTLRARGFTVSEATAQHHDKMMSVVQVLNHYQTQVLGLALSRLGIPLEDSLAFTSPAYLLETYVAARHFAQSPALYGAIEMLNPSTAAVTSAFQDSAREIADILQQRDQARFDAVFDEVRSFFGEFTEEAQEQSSFLIDRLIELTAGRSAES